MRVRRGEYPGDGFGIFDRGLWVIVPDEGDIPEFGRMPAFDDGFFLPGGVPRRTDPEEVFAGHLAVDMKGIVQDVERFHGNRLSIHGNGDIFERSDFERE